jgi:hypothetical protein
MSLNNLITKFVFVLTLYFSCLNADAQNIGIGTNIPDASSKLDISSASSGLLIPRVSLVSVMNGASPISSPATSLLVYNSNASVTGGSGTGYYFWNGTQWERLFSGAFSPNWSLTGNSGTSAATNFIGTTDAIDFVTKTNNIERMRVTSTGLVGIGLTPSYKLDVTHTSSAFDDRAINVNFSTSDNIGGFNSGIYVNSASSGTGDLFGIWSYATPTGNNNSSAIAGVVNSSGAGDRIAIASQIGGSGGDGAGLSTYILGSWTNAYGLLIDHTASATQRTYGIYVRGTPEYSGFMESGNFYVNDNVAIGIAADPPQAKLHVDGNIKSEALADLSIKRILYADVDGEILSLPNGNPGDVLMIDGTGYPAWSPYTGAQIYFSKLETPQSYGVAYTSVVSKTISPMNDTVMVEFNLSGRVDSGSGTVSPLSSFEVTLEVDGIAVAKSYGHPNTNATGGVINISFSIPVEVVSNSMSFEVFIQRYTTPNITITVDPMVFGDQQNATLTIYDLPTN